MLDAIAELTKSSLIPGTLSFLLFGLTLGALLLYGPRQARRIGMTILTLLALGYWVGSVPIVADALATRFHARNAGQVTVENISGAKAIVVLGAGIRTSYKAGGHGVAIPDPQTVYNAVEAARIYQLVQGGLPVVASGGKQPYSSDETIESLVLRDWLTRAGVPPERITLESDSRNTREQAQFVGLLLKANHWERFVLVTPAVQGPRAAAVFRREGVDPIIASAPFAADSDRQSSERWMPNLGALRESERAIYDYLAWAYYWTRGWLR
jgi:uncharacterized SAM-binding protein YcdF (DUF218 family)